MCCCCGAGGTDECDCVDCCANVVVVVATVGWPLLLSTSTVDEFTIDLLIMPLSFWLLSIHWTASGQREEKKRKIKENKIRTQNEAMESRRSYEPSIKLLVLFEITADTCGWLLNPCEGIMLCVACCCCWSCCCSISISCIVSQMLNQSRFDGPSCSSWNQPMDGSIHPRSSVVHTKENNKNQKRKN